MKRRGARNKLRIGNFLTFTGSPGIWGPTSTNSAMLTTPRSTSAAAFSAASSNSQIYDSGGPIDEVVQRAEQAIAFDEVDLIMGSHISAVRVALAQGHRRHRIPYIYTPVYEGRSARRA